MRERVTGSVSAVRVKLFARATARKISNRRNVIGFF
jgi:ribosomal protein S28E/S33